MGVLKYIFYLYWQSASTFEPDHVFLVVLPRLLPLAQGILHCLFIGIMLSSQCYFKCPFWWHVWYAQFVWHSAIVGCKSYSPVSKISEPCCLVSYIAAIIILNLFNSCVKFLSAHALKTLLTFHVAKFQSFFIFREPFSFHIHRLDWLVTLGFSTGNVFTEVGVSAPRSIPHPGRQITLLLDYHSLVKMIQL